MAISLIFSITWLPLNVLNLTLDLYNPFKLPRDKEMMLIIYAACHLFGMSSACANPFLYGWFNENFRNEFKLIFSAPSRLLCPVKPAVNGHLRRSPVTAFTSAVDTISTPGQSRQRRMSSTQSTIDTKNIKTNNIVGSLGAGHPLTTVKELSETITDHQNAVETNKPNSRPTTSPTEGHNKTESNENCQAHSFEMDDKVNLHLVSSSIFNSKSTLETHL